ncbi:hypothetical protein LXL04_030187 [Taraxacum kok-saghyz]
MWDQSPKRTISDIFQNKSQCLENEDSNRIRHYSDTSLSYLTIPTGACSWFRLSTMTASIFSTHVYPSISSTGAATSFPARRFPSATKRSLDCGPHFSFCDLVKSELANSGNPFPKVELIDPTPYENTVYIDSINQVSNLVRKFDQPKLHSPVGVLYMLVYVARQVFDKMPLLISRTKLGEAENKQDFSSNRHVETLKQKVMKLRKENELLKRQLLESKED